MVEGDEGVLMPVRLSASEQPASSRREFWEHVACAALGSLELRITGEIDPADRIVAGVVGAVRVGALTSHRPGGAVRTARQVRRTASDLCKIDIPVDGSGVVEQGGRVARLGPGDFTLADLSRPARWAMSPGRVIAVVLPRASLPLRPDDIQRMVGVTVCGTRGAGALVSSLAERLVRHLGEYTPAEAARVGAVVPDLLAAALTSHVEADMAPDARVRAQALRIDAYIDGHLADPGLSPAMVAAAGHMSVRALHRLFESRDTTVAGWIRHRRLERCRRDLVDPALRDRPVTAVGARWALNNPAHFSRVFRAAYGVPPAEYRRRFTPSVPPSAARG
jgi:AraC-like DNA-binding protein